MNLLFANEYADPHFVSGAEYSMQALVEALKEKVKLFILSPNLGHQPRDKKVKHIKFPFLKKLKPGKSLTPLWFNNPIFRLYASYWIIKAIKTNKIDLIHVHGKYILPAAIVAGKLTGTPVIITVRDFKFLCPLALCYTNQQKTCRFSYYLSQEIPQYLQRYTNYPSWLVKPQLVMAKLWQYPLKWFLKQADQIIAVSPQLAKIYKTANLKKVISIYNLPPEEQKQKKKTSSKTVLSVGKLSYGKGTDTLLKAAAILEKKLPQVKFILAGSKNISLKSDFPKNCRYLGKLPHYQVLKLYQKADVFIINSRWPEPLSRAALEALSFGLPIIASNRGGNREVVKNKLSGFLVSPEKPDQIVQAIQKVLINLPSFSQQSRKLFKQRFNRSQILNQHLKLYQNLL